MTEPPAKSSPAPGACGLKFVVLGETCLFAALVAEDDRRERSCQLVLEIGLQGACPPDLKAPPDADWFLTNLRLDGSNADPLTASMLASQSKPWSFFRADVAMAPPGLRSDAPPQGAPIVQSVGFEVLRLVYFRPMIETIAPPKLPLCLMFGKSDEAHLIHLRFREPGFDRIATLEGRPTWLAPDIVSAGAILVLSGPRAGSDPSPFVDGETVELNYRGRDVPREAKIKRARWFSAH